ncbi:MAG TPA: hypothetical protein PK836_00350 [Syntrophales bacterium]|nr:hypothetical protein [Syntrophales bacterium]HOM06277.1 hypothetical protein [Syntrophales bacterium]HON99284.1 hypothetical protein [Syntrophales bacterium]HPC00109.1 hypothetical protein [Syntrophales bacterium]HPQ05742.1 hypothetical protein [Syntrophales bacterium]
MKRITLTLACCLVLLGGTAWAQTALEAVKALKKLEGRVAVGLNYKEYAFSLADAKVETTMYLESSAARQNPALADRIRKIVDHYENARIIWNIKVQKMEDFGTAFGHLMSMKKNDKEGALGLRMLELYPQANRSAEKGGALTMGAFGSRGENEILVDNLINIIWKQAAEDLREAVRTVVH